MSPLRRLLVPLWAALLSALALPGQTDRFEIPAYRGLTGSVYAGWDVFTVASGGTNRPDRSGSATGFTLEQFDASAFLTSGGNIYSFSAPLVLEVLSPALATIPGAVVLQTRTLGTLLDPASLGLERRVGGIWSPVPGRLDELLFSEAVGTGFGAAVDETRRWTWVTQGLPAEALRLRFAAASSSLSLLAVDLDLSPPTVVPEPAAGAGLAAATLLVAAALIHRRTQP